MRTAPRSRASLLPFALAILSAVGAAWPGIGESAAGPPPSPKSQAETPKPPVPAAAILEPEDLARILGSRAAEKPLIFQIGFRFLYKEAHIPGAEYIGPASKEDGLKQLRQRVAPVPHGKPIVLYCGCCPWIRCPNVKPAYHALHAMGFTQVKVLRIEENFGANWVAKGYPTAKGE